MQTKGVGTKKHVHSKMLVKDLTDGEVSESHKTYKHHNSFSIEDCTNTITHNFQFTEYEKHYAFYKDGNTEMIHLEGTVLDEKLKLTLDVFTCYCEPLNENQEPPF